MKQIPPLHPSANPAETFMKLGKTMRIAHFNKTHTEEALQQLRENYHDNPHPATGLSPQAMKFRDGQEGAFPRTIASEEDVEAARECDQLLKHRQEMAVNSSTFRKCEEIKEGDIVHSGRTIRKGPSLIQTTFRNPSK